MDRGQYIQIVVTLIIPVVMVIGAWFTQQADLAHLETRIAQDETQYESRLTELETRLRISEIDTASRLSRIETQLDSITIYMQAISERLQISPTMATLNGE